MNEDLKYVLLPTIEKRRRTPKFQPWYRERLKMKYPCRMDTKNWKFVKDGLDDFRDGLPPPHDHIILEPEKGPSPVVFSQTRRIKATASDVRHRLKDHQIYFSRELPTAEKRRQLIDHYISSILEHPVAFFSHFNQALEPELYERLTKLLEAELSRMAGDEENVFTDEYKEHISLTSSYSNTRPETGATARHFLEGSFPSNNEASLEKSSDTKSSTTRPGRNAVIYDEYGNQWDKEEWERKENNPYRWFIEKQREKQMTKGRTLDEEAEGEMEAHLRSVTERFCHWLYDLAGEKTEDIEPALVRNLFSTAYDTKPSLSAPIKIVETTRIPPELREGVQESILAGSDQPRSTISQLPSLSKFHKLPSLPTELDQQSPRKYRYGAWYLPKNLWRRSLTTEQLRDPKQIKAELEDETRKRDEQINARLAPLHGIDAFREFLMEKNVRRLPKLITDVDQYRSDHPREITQTSLDLPAKQTS